MSLLDTIETDLANVFFTDFATKVRPTTWGGCDIDAIFDQDLIDLEEATMVAPYVLVPTSRIPDSAGQGDILSINGIDYQVHDIEYEEPNISRIRLRKP